MKLRWYTPIPETKIEFEVNEDEFREQLLNSLIDFRIQTRNFDYPYGNLEVYLPTKVWAHPKFRSDKCAFRIPAVRPGAGDDAPSDIDVINECYTDWLYSCKAIIASTIYHQSKS